MASKKIKINEKALAKFESNWNQSEEGRWLCAATVHQALAVEGDDPGEWSRRLKLSVRALLAMADTWSEFGDENSRYPDLTFNDHKTLAPLSESRRQQLIKKGNIEGVRIATAERRISRQIREERQIRTAAEVVAGAETSMKSSEDKFFDAMAAARSFAQTAGEKHLPLAMDEGMHDIRVIRAIRAAEALANSADLITAQLKQYRDQQQTG